MGWRSRFECGWDIAGQNLAQGSAASTIDCKSFLIMIYDLHKDQSNSVVKFCKP